MSSSTPHFSLPFLRSPCLGHASPMWCYYLLLHWLKQTWYFNRRSVVSSLLWTQHESHNGVPPGLTVTLNQDGSTPAQPDEGSLFHAVNWGRLLKMRKWSMWHNDLSLTVTHFRYEPLPKTRGAWARIASFLLIKYSLHDKYYHFGVFIITIPEDAHGWWLYWKIQYVAMKNW